MKNAIALFVAAIMTAPALGQTASALLHEGDALGPAGHNVASLSNPAANHVGGYAISLNTSDGVTTLSHIWGNAGGGLGALLRTEATFGPLVQTSFESFYGMSDAGSLAYSASGSGGPVGAFDSVWLDDSPVAVEGDAHPTLPGQFWRFASRPSVTGDGTPYFVGGITDTQGGATQNRGLFSGMDGGTVHLVGGDALTGLPFALNTSTTISFDYRVSRLGSHYLAEVQMASGSSLNDDVMAMDGAGLLLGGGLVREGSPVPAAIGGLPGENWSSFDFVGITESGGMLITGDTSASTAVDEFVLVDGNIALREGDMTPSGDIVSGSIEGGYMNESGDWAATWDVSGGALEALIVNGDVLIREGDLVDWDGDGIPDVGHTLTDFTGISSLVLGNRDVNNVFDVFFVADVVTPDGTLEGFFRVTVPEPASALLLSLGVLSLRRRRKT